MRTSKTPRNITHRECIWIATGHETFLTKDIEANGREDRYTHVA
jgi:hypothetical protein